MLYDGFRLAVSVLVVLIAFTNDTHAWSRLTWWWVVLGMTAFSWLYAPSVFNPYQFAHRYFCHDIVQWYEFMISNRSSAWITWFEKTQLVTGTSLRLIVVKARTKNE